MVMNVGKVNSINFKEQHKKAENTISANTIMPQINDISNVTPSYTVRVPQKYTKLGVTELKNGLQLHSYKLANGHKITIVPMENSPAIVKNYVNVGSMNETPYIKGISHFLEHMAFNGTNGTAGYEKLDVGDSFKKIDAIGGWANASTNYAVTDYVNSSPLLQNSDIQTQIKVIAAMTEDLKLSEAMIEKEKGPVCSEINMIMDDPQTIAMDQTVRTLYNIKNPADELVGGSVAHIKNLTRNDVKNYYDKYYTPDNMNLVITGDVNPDEIIEIVSKSFHSNKTSKGEKYEEKLTPVNHTVRKDFVCDKAKSASIVLGFAGPKNNDAKEKLVYQIAKSYLWSHSSNLEKNLRKYNSYPYISQEKISTNPKANQFIYLATTTADKNTEQVLREIYNSISELKPIDNTRLNEIKQGFLTEHEDLLQFSESVNTSIGNCILNNTLEQFTETEKIIDSITTEDVNKALKTYFDLSKTAITVVHPKNQDEISFHGKTRQPINTELISETKLDNNMQVGLYETNSNNIKYQVQLQTQIPYNKKAGVTDVLDEIYSMGFQGVDENELQKFNEKNNIETTALSSASSITYYGSSSYENRNLILDKAKEIIYNPAITEENLERARKKIKDNILRHQKNAYNLYAEYEAKSNPYEYTHEEILNTLDSITLEDVKDCHKYMLENSRGIITANIPKAHKEEFTNEVLNSASKFKNVQYFTNEPLKIYHAEKKPIVLTEANQNSQADIMQTYKFKYPDDIKEQVSVKLMNSILSSSSIGLFDTLREKEHLAYSVYSDVDYIGDCGELMLNILTTTDNKNIGEHPYDNVQKSINGFHKQINALKNGEFTDKDLENAKLIMKADLLNTEGASAKLASISCGMKSKHGITFLNQIYNTIDSITREDILNSAKKAFANPPIYSVVASQDTLDYNKEYLNQL